VSSRVSAYSLGARARTIRPQNFGAARRHGPVAILLSLRAETFRGLRGFGFSTVFRGQAETSDYHVRRPTAAAPRPPLATPLPASPLPLESDAWHRPPGARLCAAIGATHPSCLPETWNTRKLSAPLPVQVPFLAPMQVHIRFGNGGVYRPPHPTSYYVPAVSANCGPIFGGGNRDAPDMPESSNFERT